MIKFMKAILVTISDLLEGLLDACIVLYEGLILLVPVSRGKYTWAFDNWKRCGEQFADLQHQTVDLQELLAEEQQLHLETQNQLRLAQDQLVLSSRAYSELDNSRNLAEETFKDGVEEIIHERDAWKKAYEDLKLAIRDVLDPKGSC